MPANILVNVWSWNLKKMKTIGHELSQCKNAEERTLLQRDFNRHKNTISEIEETLLFKE